MSTNYLIDVVIPTGLYTMTEAFTLINDRPTGVYRDLTNGLVIELRLFKASITRNGETTYYSRHFFGGTTILTRLRYQVVLNHVDDMTIIDSTGTQFAKDLEVVPEGTREMSLQ